MPKTNQKTELYIGLMSGTSIDGIDAGLVDFSQSPPRLMAFHYQAFPDDLRNRIHRISLPDTAILLSDYGALDSQLGQLFAEAALALLNKANIPANEIKGIGSHGQTVYHAPDGPRGFSLQIGDPNRIAQITGITTLGDFRRRDIAAGGQGAPLVPAFHQALFAVPGKTVTVLNIGGIANISVLRDQNVLGFDTGPGNTLLDYWCRLNTGRNYDANGDWGQNGQVRPALLDRLLADAYFQQAPPKSTGKEYFSPAWLDSKLTGFKDCPATDVQTTLCELSATSIANEILAHGPDSANVLVCGGGVHNRQLMAMLRDKLPMPVLSTADYGVDPDQVEAMAFAWLARQTLNHLAGNLCSVTGAHEPVVLGGIYPGRPA
ncbi:anhydro-N-acetylmuramic acid kinase [Methylomonas sp. SURF-2]|uniref:Anhydro-N-acetylmuramic acid kinase n=1 Tax=Methylomonas subterranea TaxID=2952225 RepID=A0ABT1TKF7_9GAMM|nr:anhydro-N-acetylmuramic acid kinase [Methylomonas sp. SURF-2]MCQ8105938.1 anhydro-N-acetylmuramic acid kinase [Methylomonas sp. SURF-2]